MTGRPLPSDYYPGFIYNVFRLGDPSAFRVAKGYYHCLRCLDGGIIDEFNTNKYDTAPAYDAFIHYLLTDNHTYLDRFYEYVKEYIRTCIVGRVINILDDLKGSESGYGKPSDRNLQLMQEEVDEKHQSDRFFHIDVYQLEWELQSKEVGSDRFPYNPIFTTTHWHPKPGQEDKFIDYIALDRLVEETFAEEVEIFEERLSELKDVMQALADEPISAGSGIKQPRKRQQLHYLPHARRTISHPQRTYQDVMNELATQLSSLPNFTARTRITVEGQTVEYTLKTFEPEKGLYGKLLQERIARIQASNIQDGILRNRAAVEAEITQRQTGCSSGAAPAQPQQQTRHARNVSMQTNCPTCGTSNPTQAQFCNQCGSKLT